MNLDYAKHSTAYGGGRRALLVSTPRAAALGRPPPRGGAGKLGATLRFLMGLLLVTGVSGAIAALGQAPSARAAVGAVPSSPVPVVKAAAAGSAASSTLYATHATQLESGTVVREFSSSSGVVFAVSWQGPVLPDLTQLLGDYFNTFKAAAEQARASGRRGAPIGFARDDLVVNSNGRMRDFSGYAYAPGLIPSGLEIKDVLP